MASSTLPPADESAHSLPTLLPDEPWPGDVPPVQKEWLSIPFTGQGHTRDWVLIGWVPTPRSWEVPAYLRFGGCNDNPLPEEHVAVLRGWHEQFGAEVLGLKRDTLEMEVQRPPDTREAAWVLAREQGEYCPDLVDPDDNALLRRAASLLGARYWQFWWDHGRKPVGRLVCGQLVEGAVDPAALGLLEERTRFRRWAVGFFTWTPR